MQNETRPHESLEQILSLNFLCRFWLKVNKTDGCWLWTGSAISAGYGHIGIWKRQTTVYAHRASWIMHNGPIPDGLHVLHDCPGKDNPLCIRPEHLWLGTHKDNMGDMAQKGMAAQAKMNPDQILQIRYMREQNGMTHKALGLLFGLDRSVISDIVHRRTWKHVPPAHPTPLVLTQPELL